MKVATGKSILDGIAIGPLHFYHKVDTEIVMASKLTPAEELSRFATAQGKAQEQLGALYDKALEEVGEDNAAIFEIHQMMVEDDDYVEAIQSIIETQGATAEYAVSTTGDNFAATFAAMDDAYMKARAVDVKDISRRLVNILTGADEGNLLGDKPVILVADDLTPSETVQMDKSKLLGFVTRKGSTNSHTAILARTMNIPALIGVEIDEDWDGKPGIIDGYNHCVYVEPTADLATSMQKKHNEDLQQRALLQGLKGKENVTLDGRHVNLYANIGNVGDVGLVLQNDASGIGLFRSEFIYLNSQDYPTEDEQFAIYKQVVETMGGRKVIIRTLDIGADKQADYFNLDKEENPALGFRAIRICLTRKEIFKTQLRAILRASAYGKVSIMFPMIISVREVRDAKDVLAECRKELADKGVAMGEVEIGIMIETPAAVVMADELAQEVEFFSLGTNDLTQYTLAIDRQNPKLDAFYDPHHPAVLRMIRRTVEAGHRHNCWVGICGELGADPKLTETFLRMGVDELSVSPSSILPLRKIVRGLDLTKEPSNVDCPEF
ncbi:MAG: phosphoenolpyruvate--protein phosphotransferase [Oscillospiraceae bacterium]|nr:phosphoenolpyruvate--protein phosphotransferase [Oscillospiraceae bacterium]MBP3520063.1 phosphoenolpyruvate--protein phosphotransferase [Oscillospiraceae bacterium]